MWLDLYFAMLFMVLVVLVRGLGQYAYRRRRIDHLRKCSGRLHDAGGELW
jgi:hypothetical protein